MRFFAFLVLCSAGLLLGHSPAHAQSAADTRQALTGALSELKAANARQKQWEKKNAEMESELGHLQEEMVGIARSTKDQEQALSEQEEKLGILEDQKRSKQQALDARQKELSTALSAMVRLSTLPPEAVIAMPGKLDETLATARALGIVTHAVQEEAESLKAQIHELDALSDKIKQNHDAIEAKKTLLETQKHDLDGKVKERTHLQAELGGKAREEKERASQLMAKSQNLQELLESLQKAEHKKAEMPTIASKHAPKEKHTMRSVVSAQGSLPMPAAGKIISRFGNTGAGAEFSKGLVVETRPGAGVVAPFDGEVVFAGPFRGYGHMVIIRHSNDYHTLLSGMEQIDCTAGQFLLEGEPIGTMGKQSDARLYLELRKDGKPVDPSPWFKG